MVAKSVARAGPLRRGVRPRIPTLQRLLYGQPDQLTATVLGRDVCPFGLTIIVKEQLFQRGTICCDDNRLAISVQTHFFDSGSAAAVGGQERTGPRLFARLATVMYSVMFVRGNGVIHRAKNLLQGDDNGHVGRPC